MHHGQTPLLFIEKPSAVCPFRDFLSSEGYLALSHSLPRRAQTQRLVKVGNKGPAISVKTTLMGHFSSTFPIGWLRLSLSLLCSSTFPFSYPASFFSFHRFWYQEHLIISIPALKFHIRVCFPVNPTSDLQQWKRFLEARIFILFTDANMFPVLVTVSSK